MQYTCAVLSPAQCRYPDLAWSIKILAEEKAKLEKESHLRSQARAKAIAEAKQAARTPIKLEGQTLARAKDPKNSKSGKLSVFRSERRTCEANPMLDLVTKKKISCKHPSCQKIQMTQCSASQLDYHFSSSPGMRASFQGIVCLYEWKIECEARLST